MKFLFLESGREVYFTSGSFGFTDPPFVQTGALSQKFKYAVPF
jgi:hypothetical protein